MTAAPSGISILRMTPGQVGEPRILLPPEGAVDGPLVSCLMVTRGTCFPAIHAIDCFRRQSYARRELVIVCDRPKSALAALVADLADPTIRFVETAPATLGELRNASVAHAHGELLCQWDDDDLFHVERIAMMAHALLTSDVAATMLHRWTIWWPDRRVIAHSGRRAWEGTMLVRRGALPAYPAWSRGEDKAVIDWLLGLHTVVLVDQPRAYCYVIHGANSYDTPHFDTMLSWVTERTEPEGYESSLAALDGLVPAAAYAAGLAAIPAAITA